MPRFLAIDWDQNQLHVVSGATGGGKVKFLRAVRWREDKSPNPAEAEEAGKLLRERLKEAGIAPAPVLACIGRDRVILKDIRFPAVPAAEEAGVVRFQAVKELSDSPDDVVIDYANVTPPGAGEQQALALIVRRELLVAYQKMCQAAGLKLAALTPRPFGLAAALRKATAAAPAEEADGAVAALAVGERWAEFCVLRGQAPLLARAAAVGPGLAGEVRRNLTVYGGQGGRPPVRALYVAGAGPELRERLGELIDLPVRDFDPLAGSPDLDVPAESRGGFAGAAGLLLARAEGRGLAINFVQPREPKPVADPKKRRVALVALALVVAIIGIAYCCWLIINNARNNLLMIQGQRDQKEALLTEARKQGKLHKALDEWDNVVAIDEIYDLTDRIPDVNVLRITQLSLEPITHTGKEKYTARLTLKGNVVGDQGRKALDQLMDGFKQDGYYSPLPPKWVGNQFTLEVKVERRAPSEYKRTLPPAPDQGLNSGFGPDFGEFQP